MQLVHHAPSNAIGNDHEIVALRREIAPIARHKLEPMQLGDGRLKRVGQFPAVVPAKGRREIRGRLIDPQGRKAIEETGCFAHRSRLGSNQDLGARYYGHGGGGMVRGQVVRSRRNAVEMVDQYDRIQQQLHLRLPHSPRSLHWYVSPSPKFPAPDVSRSRRSNPDGLVNNALAMAAKATTATIPIVMTGISDPVALGLVASLARPGGNVTGISAYTDDLVPKRLELLKAAVPKAVRIAMLRCTECGNFNAEQQAALFTKQSAAAQALGASLLSVELNAPLAFDRATGALVRERPDAVLLGNNPMTSLFWRELAAFAIAHRLPTMAGGREMALVRALMSYGPSVADNFRGAAIFVDKIFKGAKPADLPVEQPTKFELVINLKTARALGLTIPQSLLLRADEVIR